MGAMIVLKANGQTIRTERTTPPTLEELQAAVGGYIELIPVLYKGIKCQMFVNEEGMLRHLPLNRDASSIVYHTAVAMAAKNGKKLSFRTQIIVGDVVLLDGIKID